MTISRIRAAGLVMALLMATALSVGAQTSLEDQIAVVLRHGVILPFENDTCPPQWSVYSKATGRFLKGVDSESAYGTPGGSSEHLHTGTTGSRPNGTRYAHNGDDHTVSNWDHHHKSLNISVVNHEPPFVAVIFCKYTG